MPTLRDARKPLSRYSGQGNSFAERLNLVQERLLPLGNWKGTKDRVRFAVYVDARGNRIVTPPRDYENILAGAYEACPPNLNNFTGPGCGGLPLPVRNGWYELASDGPGNLVGTDPRRGIIRVEGQFTTFADWNTPLILRIKLEQDESPGIKIILRGKADGKKIYSLDAGVWIEGVAVNLTNATVSTTQLFDEPPYEIIKPVTKGRILLYTVDTSSNETLCGFYDPDETGPAYNRFKVPACETSLVASFSAIGIRAESTAFITVCKKAYKPAYDDNDRLMIGNFGALRMGLDALQKEDASDYERAAKLWAAAEKILKDEEDNLVGASAQGVVQVEDDYQMGYVGEQMGADYSFGYGYWPGWDW